MVERVTIEDLQSLAALYEELNGCKTDIERMTESFRRIEADPNYYLLCYKNQSNEICGSVMGIVCHDVVGDCRPFMVIENVIVSSKFRGQGVGRQLMEKVESIARERNCYYTMFISLRKRKEAHMFYESLGYRNDVVQGYKKYL